MINMARRVYSFYQTKRMLIYLYSLEYNIRVDAYIPELPADNTEVKITAFINEAANAKPAFLKTRVNGDVATSLSPPIKTLLL